MAFRRGVTLFSKKKFNLNAGGKNYLWTMSTPRAKPALPFYPESSVEKWVFNVHAWKTSTLNGVKLLDPKLSKFDLALNAWKGYQLPSRGFKSTEGDDPINKSLRGIIGRKPLLVYKTEKDKTGKEKRVVDEVETAHRMHKHQMGDIHGVSTSCGIWTPLSFSSYLAKEHEIAFFNIRNIPEAHRRMQVYDRSLNPTGADGDTLDYSGEIEMTMSAVHVSSIPFRLIRVGVQFHIQANPLYVDRCTLTPELEKEYNSLLKSFYKIADVVRLSPETYTDQILKFQVQQADCYSKYAAHLKEDPLRCEVIESEMAIPKPESELTFKA
ncbi:hypothetical protein [Legionella waltersii]|uniref:Uncharacterized protein n=1 Tax=Legionella waltersii TaxID=66969 RepID=A0A0W1ALC7_9GAMM|nr:hypothetical protein [Legionella waltersii]KTD82155.1 hypothetical protein Lwal_0982 [Legionella waltersii]SNV10869.1 Uncharacterised protein [Legionella waltersii]